MIENIIQKQIIDVTINAPVNGFEFQNEVESLCRLKLKIELENLLAKYNSLEEVIRIELLFAEVEYNSLADFQNLFAEKILAEIEKQLDEKITYSDAATSDSTSSKADRLVRLLVFYLRNGFLPWWSTVKTSPDWQEQLNKLIAEENRTADWTILYQALKEREVRTRLLGVLNQQQFWKLIEIIAEVNTAGLHADYDILLASFRNGKHQNTFGQGFKDILLYSIAKVSNSKTLIDLFSNTLVSDIELKYPKLISAIAADKINTPALKSSLKKIRNPLNDTLKSAEIQLIIPDKTKFEEGLISAITADKINTPALKSSLKKIRNPLNNTLKSAELKLIIPDNTKMEEGLIAVNDLQQNSDSDNEEIYINNAGLVIVAAYLPIFFKDSGLISKAGVLDTEKAIAVLQYIVKGVEGYDEFETVLPKILCGIELSKPISKFKLSKKEKLKVKELLESVLEHWAVLKSTSIDGLRNSFLQREGKLIYKNNNWNLKVKQEAYDMLISHIPWNISLIKLPWMKGMLNVEWT